MGTSTSDVTTSPMVLSSDGSDDSSSASTSSNAGPPTAGLTSTVTSNATMTTTSTQGAPTAGAGSSGETMTAPAGSWSYSWSYGNPSTSSSVLSSQTGGQSGSGSSPTGGSSGTSTASSPSSSSSSSTNSSGQQAYLDSTNQVRSQHGANSLTWSDTLASYDQNWANNCQFKHSGGQYGENIYAGSGSSSPSAAVSDWAAEACKSLDFCWSTVLTSSKPNTTLLTRQTRTSLSSYGNRLLNLVVPLLNAAISSPGSLIPHSSYANMTLLGMWEDNISKLGRLNSEHPLTSIQAKCTSVKIMVMVPAHGAQVVSSKPKTLVRVGSGNRLS